MVLTINPPKTIHKKKEPGKSEDPDIWRIHEMTYAVGYENMSYFKLEAHISFWVYKKLTYVLIIITESQSVQNST